jgi:hypothetical protein
MAQWEMGVEPGRPWKWCGANFEKAIAAAWSQYGAWIHRLEWSPDRTSVAAAGTGFDIRLSYDDRNVHGGGTLPMTVKLLAGSIKAFIARSLK